MGSTPSAPDPMMSSMVQAQMYKDAAREQQRMNMVGQTTPYGSLNWEGDPNAPGGYRAVQQLNPQTQALFDQNIANQTAAGKTEANLFANAGDAMSKPLKLGWDETSQRLSDMSRSIMDPQWERNQNKFDQQMADRGLMPGSAGYDNSYRDFNTSKSDAYTKMNLDAYDRAVANQTAEWQSPFNALASLMNGSQMQATPNFGLTQTPQETIQAPDYMGMAQNNYNTQMKSHDAMMGGLFGLGGSLMGMMK